GKERAWPVAAKEATREQGERGVPHQAYGKGQGGGGVAPAIFLGESHKEHAGGGKRALHQQHGAEADRHDNPAVVQTPCRSRPRVLCCHYVVGASRRCAPASTTRRSNVS